MAVFDMEILQAGGGRFGGLSSLALRSIVQGMKVQ